MSISASVTLLRPLSLASPQTLKPTVSPSPSLSHSTSKNHRRTLRCNAQLPADLPELAPPVTSALPAGLANLANLAPATSAAYAALLLAGGVYAYSKSGSKGSVIGGVSGAALMSAAYYLMQSPETKEFGDALGFGSAFLFSSVFGIRLVATQKLIPSGVLLALSVCASAVFLSAYLQVKL